MWKGAEEENKRGEKGARRRKEEPRKEGNRGKEKIEGNKRD